MLHKKFSQEDFATWFFKQKNWSMWNKKFVYVLKTFKAMNKNNPRTDSPQQNKKNVLATDAYFKVSTPIRSQGQ